MLQRQTLVPGLVDAPPLFTEEHVLLQYLYSLCPCACSPPEPLMLHSPDVLQIPCSAHLGSVRLTDSHHGIAYATTLLGTSGSIAKGHTQVPHTKAAATSPIC